MKQDVTKLIFEAAEQHGLDPVVLVAIVGQESQGDPWLNRFEYNFFNHPKYRPVMEAETRAFLRNAAFPVSFDTEVHNRATSWGLMQVMGQVARERGYRGPIAQLCDPVIGLEFGCRQFVRKLEKARGNLEAALLAYNGGGRPQYVAEVLERIRRIREGG